MRDMFKAVAAVLRTHKDVGEYSQTHPPFFRRSATFFRAPACAVGTFRKARTLGDSAPLRYISTCETWASLRARDPHVCRTRSFDRSTRTYRGCITTHSNSRTARLFF
jgi:hypothetical protein